MKEVYTKSIKPETADELDDDVFSTYVIHLAEKRNYLFTLVDESQASVEDGASLINRIVNKYSGSRRRTARATERILPTAYINVIDIQQGKVISQIHA